MYLNNNLVLLLVAFCAVWTTISANHKAAIPSTHIRSNIIANSNSKSHSNSGPNGATNGGIYFSDIPLRDTDVEGSADGPDDDLDDNASGKGEDDEDTKDLIGGKEGSGSQPIGGDLDTDDDDIEEGSGDESVFISSTERPTKRPEIIKTPVTTPQESKEPKRKDPIPEDIDVNRVPIDFTPVVVATPETSTRFMVPSSTQWPDSEDENNNLSNEVSIMGQKQVTPASFFARPGILAAVIGGAVVGLLCAILLVMFIVYRMRKKDEGSYALDEPKRSTPANPYARGSSKEFYA